MRRPEATSRRTRERTPERQPTRAAVAVLAGLACWAAAGSARAHEPFEITADARIGGAETTLRLLIAGHTAQLLCGALPQSSSPDRWRRCGGALFALAGADGRSLPVGQVDARVTVEGDVAVTAQYRSPSSGPLRLDATFLQRLPDPTYGATLTVTGPGVFLGQRVLRASAPSIVVMVPSPQFAPPALGSIDPRWPVGVASVLVLAAAAIATALGRRRAGRDP